MSTELNNLYGDAATLVSLPGLDLADFANPPHIFHNSTGNVTMRAVTLSGKYRIDWGDGTVTGLEYSGTELTHDYVIPGWKRIRFLDELGNSDLIAQLWPRVASNAIADIRSLREIQKYDAPQTGLIDLKVSGCRKLNSVKVDSNLLSATIIDRLLIDLDVNGLSNGLLNYTGNPGAGSANRSSIAAIARTSLLARGWTITG